MFDAAFGAYTDLEKIPRFQAGSSQQEDEPSEDDMEPVSDDINLVVDDSMDGMGSRSTKKTRLSNYGIEGGGHEGI